jgi:hypothetical protein
MGAISMAKTTEELAPYSADKMVSDEIAHDITSAADWEKFTGTKVVEIGDIIPGFTVVEKSELVGVPILLLGWRINTSNKYAGSDGAMLEFASVLVRDLARSRTVVFNDGGTGIPAQLGLLESKGVTGGVSVPNGLRVSEYLFTDDEGSRMAHTHYLSN